MSSACALTVALSLLNTISKQHLLLGNISQLQVVVTLSFVNLCHASSGADRKPHWVLLLEESHIIV